MKKEAFKRFLKDDATLAAVNAGGLMLLAGLIGVTPTNNFATWIIFAIISGLFGVAISSARRKYVDGLISRINANAPIEWDVTLNGVKVGRIRDAEYAAICLRTFSAKRTYIAQALNIGKVFIKAFNHLYIAIPLGVFWMFVTLAVFAPDSFANIITEFSSGGAAAIAWVAKIGAQLFGILMVMSIMVHAALGLSRFGFINRFSEAINTAVRKHCGAAADGDITLSRAVFSRTDTGEQAVKLREAEFTKVRGSH